MKKVYLDSCILIYLVEAHPEYRLRIQKAIEGLGSVPATVTELVRLECKVLPIRNNDPELAAAFDEVIDDLAIIEVDREVFERAAQLRASFRFLKTPDAIHLAAAQIAGCDEFWTTDEAIVSAAPSLVRLID